MGLTGAQDIPIQPQVSTPWTFRHLLSFGGGLPKVLGQQFKSPFEWLLGLLVITLALNELLGREASGFFIVLTVSIFSVVCFERCFDDSDKEATEDKSENQTVSSK